MAWIKSFLQSPSAGGVLLLISAALAVGVANSSLAEQYFMFLNYRWDHSRLICGLTMFNGHILLRRWS